MIQYEAWAWIALNLLSLLHSIAYAGELRRDPRYPQGGFLVFVLSVQAWGLSIVWRLM